LKESKSSVLTVYIGWDSREPIAADVCRYSILEHASIPVNIVYLKQDELRDQGLYYRPIDDLGSTEFTFTRFLVPHLNNYAGWAVFVDCDFVFVEDIAQLLEQANQTKAVQVVQHDYTPPACVKMDGKQQHPYPRKNWSSMILWNCNHKDNKKVTLDFANTATGQELHRFTWLKDKDIGNLAPEWNWLVGWYREIRDGHPKAIHYTLGGPWFDNYRDCEYADVWNRYRDSFENSKSQRYVTVQDLTLPDYYKDLLEKILQTHRDTTGRYYKNNVDDIVSQLNYIRRPTCFGLMDAEDTLPQGQEMSTDHIVENFVTGATGAIGSWADRDNIPADVPFVVRGIAKRKVMHWCKANSRDFYYIDTGYFGNGKHKTWHRITKNALQYDKPIDLKCPDDRLLRTGIGFNKFRGGRNILICPPSQKALMFWGVDLQEWLRTTVEEIKKHTGRPIVIREKQSRSTRVNEDTIEMALSRDVHCMVTYNSIAAVEALIYGKPVFTMGPNAAEPLANRDLSKIEKPFIPTIDEVRALCCNLAYAQFTTAEMTDGTAWRILNGL
jgi:hypothetical protein